MADPKHDIEDEVQQLLSLQRTVNNLETELMANEQFQKFIQYSKRLQEENTVLWDKIEKEMIEHDIRSIKGEWGSLQIQTRTGFTIDPAHLDHKYIKHIPDMALIRNTYRLEGEAPDGCTPKTTKYLVKRIK